MLAFTFNEHHQLVMSATLKDLTSVRWEVRREADRRHGFPGYSLISWIFPHDQGLSRVEVADALESMFCQSMEPTKRYITRTAIRFLAASKDLSRDYDRVSKKFERQQKKIRAA